MSGAAVGRSLRTYACVIPFNKPRIRLEEPQSLIARRLHAGWHVP
jgi:hypothetical protein